MYMYRFTTKLLVISVLTLLVYQQANAQILFGPKVGYQASWIRYAQLYDGADYTEGLDLSPQFGAVYSFRLSKALSFYSELFYAQRGKREKTNDAVTLMRNHTATYHFMELPLMIRLEHPLSKGKKSSPRVYINVGPHIGFWLAGKGELESLETYGTISRVRTSYSINFSDGGQENELYAEDANRLQFGLNAGTGLMIPMNKKGEILQIDFRYTHSSTFLGSDLDLEIGSTGVEENFSFGHSFASVSVAYAFYLDIWGLRKGKSVRRR